MVHPPARDQPGASRKPTDAHLRTVSCPAVAEPQTTARADLRRCPDPLRARAGALAVRCAFPSRSLPTRRVCCCGSCRRRSDVTFRRFAPSVTSRGAVWCATHAVGLRPACSWCSLSVLVLPAGADFVVTILRCAPPRSLSHPSVLTSRGSCTCDLEQTSSQLTVSICLRGGVVQRACFAALSPTCGR